MKNFKFTIFVFLLILGFISKAEAFYSFESSSKSLHLKESNHKKNGNEDAKYVSFIEESKEETEDDSENDFFSFSCTHQTFAFLEKSLFSANQLLLYDLVSAPFRSFDYLFILFRNLRN